MVIALSLNGDSVTSDWLDNMASCHMDILALRNAFPDAPDDQMADALKKHGHSFTVATGLLLAITILPRALLLSGLVLPQVSWT